MGLTTAVTIRTDIRVEEVYARARGEKHARVSRRLLGIAAILEGKTRSYAAKIAGLTIDNIRVWIRRFNEKGFEGLISKKQPGMKPKWTKEIEEYLKNKALGGAVFERDGRVVFRLEDFQSDLEKKFGVRFGISTIWYKLTELGLSWISPRAQHPKSNQKAQEAFKKKCLN